MDGVDKMKLANLIQNGHRLFLLSARKWAEKGGEGDYMGMATGKRVGYIVGTGIVGHV